MLIKVEFNQRRSESVRWWFSDSINSPSIWFSRRCWIAIHHFRPIKNCQVRSSLVNTVQCILLSGHCLDPKLYRNWWLVTVKLYHAAMTLSWHYHDIVMTLSLEQAIIISIRENMAWHICFGPSRQKHHQHSLSITPSLMHGATLTSSSSSLSSSLSMTVSLTLACY